ncbi:hypothetical protein SAMN05216251_12719 [Actinacidiphila alni]|uniref:Uncharacterized protein n=1 Tax=Actinacidiphila alni TaxID=380248 RepID=A0A1I2L815_9ACTN|nr:hypothetical protein SAMN05216251_12719 [Actinacidiphila alni]
MGKDSGLAHPLKNAGAFRPPQCREWGIAGTGGDL